MNELEELARRCEEATGADRELDGEIASLMHARHGWHAADCLADFTASLDAAMSLIPQGWRVSQLSQLSGAPNWSIMLWVDDATTHLEEVPTAGAHTAPLALTGAALRARALMQSDAIGAQHHRSSE